MIKLQHNFWGPLGWYIVLQCGSLEGPFCALNIENMRVEGYYAAAGKVF